MYEEGEVPSPAMSEVLVPVLIYSATYLTGLLGNILILLALPYAWVSYKKSFPGVSDFQ